MAIGRSRAHDARFPTCINARSTRAVKLLVLGGTQFLGRHVVEAALDRGIEVTTFTRGRTNPSLFPHVEKLTGDRDGDHAALRGRSWDAVVDTSSYFPRQTAAAAAVLRDAVDRYVFVSTASVYAEYPPGGATESTPTHVALDDASSVGPESYGPLKVACERVIVTTFGERALVTRPGVLIGPHDPTNRFEYWVQRVAEGGEVLAPGDPARQLQLLDARDLVAWLLSAMERGVTGTFNASGPAEPMSMSDVLDACRQVANADARLTWVSDGFLLERAVRPWADLPLWLPAEAEGLLLVDSRKAYHEGLRCRSIRETIADLLSSGPTPATGSSGPSPRTSAISRSREHELLNAWHGAS